MPQSSGVVFVATHRFPSIGWYDIDSRLDYSCPAVSLPGVDRLATLTGTQKIPKKEFRRPELSANRQKDHLSDVNHRIDGRQMIWVIRPVG